MTSESLLAPSVIFTEAAARKVKSLIDEEGDLSLCLRVYITGGGCSGFQYGFTFDTDANINPDEDYVLVKDLGQGESVRLLIDAMSYQYLEDAEIDYREDIHGAQFVIRNPNAKTTCGCGSSFSVEDDGQETDTKK
jgi:iron-sulfur cluster insertion protein